MTSKHDLTRFTWLILAGLAIALAVPACSETASRPYFTTGDGGWEHVLYNPNGHTVFFLDDKTGWSIGAHIIFKTSDGGITWSPQKRTSQKHPLHDVWFNDANRGWVVGGGYGSDGSTGIFLRTTDGGATWHAQSPPEGVSVYSVCFTDSRTGWAAAVDHPKRECIVMKTTDAGVTWAVDSVLQKNGRVVGIRFADADHGWIVADDAVYRTTDGGKTWLKQTKMPKVRVAAKRYRRGMCFVDSSNGWVCASAGIMLRTSDGGVTWSKQEMPTQDDLLAVHFVDKDNGWAIGYGGTIVHTADGGATWSKQKSGTVQMLCDVHFFDRNKGCIFAGAGFSTRTADGGKTWAQPRPRPLGSTYACAFLDTKTGWISGHPALGIDPKTGKIARMGGSIFKTTDGGLTWTKQRNERPGDYLSRMSFVDSTHGWAVGRDGLALSTSDGGESWTTQATPGRYDLARVQFVDRKHGWVAARRPASELLKNHEFGEWMLRTNDGGKTWKELRAPVMEWLEGLCFVSPTTGWRVGANGTTIKTTDGGKTWKRQFVGTSSNLQDVRFLNSELGWVTSNDGKIFKTTDGGDTWIRQKSPTAKWLNVCFLDENAGWTRGKDGSLTTTDGGNTWTLYEPGESGGGIFFADRDNGWGWIGALLRTTTAGLPGCVWAKKQPDGKAANFGHLVVTETTSGGLYAVHPDSKIGMRFRIRNPEAKVGDYIYVHGKIASDGGEKVIDADSIDVITAGWGHVSLPEHTASR